MWLSRRQPRLLGHGGAGREGGGEEGERESSHRGGKVTNEIWMFMVVFEWGHHDGGDVDR